MAYHRYHGVDTKIVRIFNTYGPRMRLRDGRVVPAFVGQALKGEPVTVFGDGSQTRSFCYCTDLIDGIYRLSQSDFHEPVNIGNPTEFTILEFAKLIQKIIGSTAPIVHKPLPQDDPKQRRPDITRAKTLLGWEPKGVVEGVEPRPGLGCVAWCFGERPRLTGAESVVGTFPAVPTPAARNAERRDPARAARRAFRRVAAQDRAADADGIAAPDGGGAGPTG